MRSVEIRTNGGRADRACGILMVILVGLGGLPIPLQAVSHGPAFGLATPTLGKSQWSSDTVSMALDTTAGAS